MIIIYGDLKQNGGKERKGGKQSQELFNFCKLFVSFLFDNYILHEIGTIFCFYE